MLLKLLYRCKEWPLLMKCSNACVSNFGKAYGIHTTSPPTCVEKRQNMTQEDTKPTPWIIQGEGHGPIEGQCTIIPRFLKIMTKILSHVSKLQNKIITSFLWVKWTWLLSLQERLWHSVYSTGAVRRNGPLGAYIL